MKLISLLFSLCLLINSSKCGPEIFKFISQPVSQTVNPGGSVTLSCVATGRSGITYSWYRLDKDFSTPPNDLDLISGEVNTKFIVQAANVDDSGKERLFQCKATAGSDIILSNVATVLYLLADNIVYDNTGKDYINVQKSTSNQDDHNDLFLYVLSCNIKETDFDQSITNGEPYDVQWFKTGESGRVEDLHKNMWTYYGDTDTVTGYKVKVSGGHSVSVTSVKRYDLLIFNVQTSDAGTYSCKAVSRVNKQKVLLGSTVLDVPKEQNSYTIEPEEIIYGYMVLAVDSAGKIRDQPKAGDEVLLMCGVACRTSSGSLDPQYQWKDSSGTVIANTREHIVTVSSTGSVTYTCEILNSECASKLLPAEKSKSVSMTVKDADFDPTLQFTFSKSSPEYMWFDISDNSKSHDPFEIGCEGSYSSGNSGVGFHNSVLRMPDTVADAGEDVVYDFSSSFTSDKSGVYQCVMFNTPDKVVLYQQTTNVVIAAPPSAAITPSIVSVSNESTATFTCTVGGYPVESVTISGPNNVNLNCLTTQTIGDVGCSSSDQSNYVVKVQNFKLEYSGDYICTVNTKWYKDDNIAAIEDSAQDNVALSFESTTTLTASTNPANKGTTVTLTCIVKGNPAPSNPVLTKTVDGSSSDVSMTCSGTTTTKTCVKSFSSVKFTDSGDYLCSGENTIDGVKKKSSSQLALNIVGNAEATLTRTPAGSELAKDASVTFTCSIIGSPRPTKLTLKKGDVVLKSYDAAGSADSDIVTTTYGISYTHDITTLLLDDTAVYTCKGENDNGGVQTDEDTTNLTVVSDVEVTLSSSTTTPTFGDTFTITCTATGGRKPHSVELQKDGNTIIDSGFMCTSEGDYTEKCLYSSTADYTSGGTYSCTGKNRVAGNVEKEDTETVAISVSKSVSVSLTPASGTSVEVTFGTTYTVSCNVDGGDKPHKVTLNIPGNANLTWERIGQGNTLTCSGEFELSCEHQISKIAYSQEGQYTCIGYNKIPGTSTDLTDTKTVSLVIVKDVTVSLSVNPATAEIYHGTEIKITCVADGGRIPYFLEFSHTSISSTVSRLVTYDTTTSSTPATVTVDKTANTLTYVHTVAEADYEDNGSYSCISKNKASSNAERDNKKTAAVLVVKNVEIETIPNIEADFGTSFTFNFKLNGGRSPHSVKLENSKSQIFDWSGNSNECTGTNELSCSKTVGDSDVNFGYDGDYTVTAKNRALNDAVVTASKTFTVTVYKDVSATITPSTDSTLTYHVDINITCNVIGGLPPHKVDLILPNQITKTWTKDGSGNSLTCTGTHDKTCTHTFTPEYNSDGDYKCVGYNKVRSNEEKQKESTVVQLTTVRSTEVSISNETVSVLTNGTVDVHCTIVGKPLVDMSAVSWRHTELTDFDWSSNVTTIKGSEDDYTLVSTLTLVNPSTNYSGSFNCNVQAENSQVISKSVVVSINNREYLDAPVVSHNRGEATEQDVKMSVTCLVEGFPRPSATLTYQNLIDGEESRTISGASRIISPTTTEYEFKLSTSCEYTQYKFICETQTTRNSDNRVLTQSSSVEGPIVSGCENALPVIIGGGVGGGVAFIAIAVVAVFFILKKVKTSRNKEYSPKNGTQIPNPAFGADPSYATVRETPGAIGYSHLNRPVGDTTEDGYACIGQMSKQTGRAPAADAYATLDTASNGRMGLQRQGSDAAYAALNRPAPGKEKRGVIRKYKPIASRPKSTLGPPPNKAPDIEMGAITGGEQPEPTYATVNPQTKKVKENTSNYTDIPDLPPEVPVYGQGVLKKADPSEYADVTLPPPPPLPDGPIYSNMTERQGAVMDEDPVYAQVDIKSRTAKKQPAEEEEDLPPEVPIYGTMGACTEPDDEDPYATVEFIPKSKRKPPRPKAKEDESEGLYATITDFKENP